MAGICTLCGEPAWSPRARLCDDHMRKPISVEYAVAKAVRTGQLPPIKTQVCVDCGSPAHHYDHRDYSKPLDVEPVCARCNSLRGPALRPMRKRRAGA